MTRYTLFVIGAVLLLSACTPYPRYKKFTPSTPEVRHTVKPLLDTNGYLRFGWILQKYLGRPYSGKSKYREGIDCSNFVRTVYQEFNKTTLPRTVRDQFAQGTNVPRRRMAFGDLVFFETIRGRASHVGIYIGFNQFIHASSSQGVMISRLEEKYWATRLMGARRVLK